MSDYAYGISSVTLCCLRDGYSAIFFTNNTTSSEIYTLSLHDALPISAWPHPGAPIQIPVKCTAQYSSPSAGLTPQKVDRKSTRLNSSHVANSYAVCCLR